MAPMISEGLIPFRVRGETYHTWYKQVGHISPKGPRPLVVLHGGPGVTHDYMLPIGDIAAFQEGRPVVFYDQMGNGRSTHLQHKDTPFWTIDFFIDELVNLLAFFRINNDFDLLGHSWGGILAAEFIIRRQPRGLKHLILANSLASSRLRNNAVQRLRKHLPEAEQTVLREGDLAGNTSSPEYKAALFKFYEQFLCRLKPVPEQIMYSFTQSQVDPTVYAAMRQIEVNDDWDITDKIHLIRVPTLLINGEYDFEADDVCAPFFHGIRNVKWVKFAHSAHMPHWEERQRYMEVVESFLGGDKSLAYLPCKLPWWRAGVDIRTIVVGFTLGACFWAVVQCIS